MTNRNWLRRLLSRLPIVRYLYRVQEGIRQAQAEIEHQAVVTEIHARRANYYFYERNGVTPLVTSLIRGDFK